MKFDVKQALFEQCITSLQELIQIPSIKEGPSEGAPFGKPIRQALDFFLNEAVRLNLPVKNLDGYAGIVEIGEGNEELGILVHLDVVPEGNRAQWTVDPFAGTIKEGRIWGRGTLDDKGPAMAVLYAIKLIQDLSMPWKRRIRMIIGTDEESTWEDIDYYKQTEKPPAIAFTPDGYFPVTNSEKGILTLCYKKRIEQGSIVRKVEAGKVYNVTPGTAKAWIESGNRPINSDAITVQELSSDSWIVTATGADGRTSSPAAENNAIDILLRYLQTILPEDDGFWEAVDFYDKYLADPKGSGHDLVISDAASGELTLAPCILSLDDQEVVFYSNIRYPSTFSLQEVANRYQYVLDQSTFLWDVVNHKAPIHMDADIPFIQCLMKVYNTYFNRDDSPLSISGGTYARAFPNTVAFGALLPEKPLNAHEANENVELDVIRDWINIYATAIYELAVKK
ncbi:Sapep family Mn(2+)-dependent dipeptidase [Oceanobacillus neutriphilus]|uniref:Dipeptidase PepV n=1 Tax=Oceanobacillus neutriphilus TaxID=531815 RepID=A0ABQ2NQ22_9BACI|nr:Sapep family Mn(2+)-dependent dipeptidase [Oceanobacillus neutriphilus]GGP07799.1 dipeptidase PepV [Oceanobacillus neutriphilus]